MKKLLLSVLMMLCCAVPVWAGVRGDVNNDGSVDAADISTLINCLLSGTAPSGNADVDRNGSVDPADISTLINYLLNGTWPGGDEPEGEVITVNGVSFTMMPVEGGTFMMGATEEQSDDWWPDEKPAHQVTLSDFAIGQTEVTQELWQAVMGTNPSFFNGQNEWGDDFGVNLQRPVEYVSWGDCQIFITKLNSLTGKHFRLPTEAEWEFAARGGNLSQHYNYAGSNNIDEVAWYGYELNLNNAILGDLPLGDTPIPDELDTHTVATKAPNELGLYDMSGNVCEWCWDWYGEYTDDAQTNPTGTAMGYYRVIRGGAWDSYFRNCRVRYRYCAESAYYNFNLGLRLVLSDLPLDYSYNGVTFKMIHVDGGTFTMGADAQDSEARAEEMPAHQVTVSDFSIGETEVTQALWQAVMEDNPSHFTGDPQRPVEMVSWCQCLEFVSGLSEVTGLSFRLPTEAEWEFAARGGNLSQGYTYAGGNNVDDVAWYSSNSGGETHHVATKVPNELGLYDMSGNVLEWCEDWYASYGSAAQTDPMGPSTGTTRSYRSCSYNGGDWTARVVHRAGYAPNETNSRTGLRLVLDESPEQTAMPVLNTTLDEDNMTLTATGEGVITMFVDGELVSNPCTIPRGTEDKTHQVYILARAEGKRMNWWNNDITVPAGPATYTVNGVSFKMIPVPGGWFTMGASGQDSEAGAEEYPAHEVKLSTYAIGQTAVTQALWQAVMGNNPSRFTGDLQRPVEMVSWDDCQAFVLRLSELTGQTFRLPTEAEWEYAARGGNLSQGYKYAGSDNIDDVAWYTGNSGSTTHPVATKAPNELGLYDMSGNVLEWCHDIYGDYMTGRQEYPVGPANGTTRVYRSCSFGGAAKYASVSHRAGYAPNGTSNSRGLRIVRDLAGCPSDVPVIVTRESDDSVTVAAVGVGRKTLFVNGHSVQTKSDFFNYFTSAEVYTLPRRNEAYTVTVRACNLDPGYKISWSEEQTVTIPASRNETFTVNGVTFKMMAVDGGTFMMGATEEQADEAQDKEYPVHQVTLSSYSIGQTEVTQELWKAVMGSNPSHFTGNLQRPVEWVSWNDCQTFIARLNGLTGRNFRMPTEAEWEFAARGGNLSQGYKYAGSNNINGVAWYIENAKSVGESSPDYGTHAVATKAPNELGLYDMTGNVWEWCQDRYGDYTSDAQTDPTGPATGTFRILRGGSWEAKATACRVSYRYYYYSNICSESFGLRLAM